MLQPPLCPPPAPPPRRSACFFLMYWAICVLQLFISMGCDVIFIIFNRRLVAKKLVSDLRVCLWDFYALFFFYKKSNLLVFLIVINCRFFQTNPARCTIYYKAGIGILYHIILTPSRTLVCEGGTIIQDSRVYIQWQKNIYMFKNVISFGNFFKNL